MCDHGAFSQRHGRQSHAVNHIAHGMHRGLRRCEMLVDLHSALVIAHHTRGLQAQTLDLGLTPGGKHHAVHHLRLPALELQMQAVAVLADGFYAVLQMHAHAKLRHLLRQHLAQIGIKAAQQLLAAMHQRGLRTQTVEDGRKLHRDIAGAHDHHPLGQSGQMESLVRMNRIFDARNIRHAGLAAGGNQNMAGGDGFALYKHTMRA